MYIKSSNCMFLGRRLLGAVHLRGVSPVLDRMLAEFALRHERLALAVQKRKTSITHLRDSRDARDAVHRLCLDHLQRAWNRIETGAADVHDSRALGTEAIQELRLRYFADEPPARAGITSVGLRRVLATFVAVAEVEDEHPGLWPAPFLHRAQALRLQNDQARKDVSAALAEARASRVELLSAREAWLLVWKMLQPAIEGYLALGGDADSARDFFVLPVNLRPRKRAQASGTGEGPPAPTVEPEPGPDVDEIEVETDEESITDEDLEGEDALEEPDA